MDIFMSRKYLHLTFVYLLFLVSCQCKLPGMLYPRDSESRSLRRLDGMWNFLADYSPSRNESFTQSWFSRPLSQSGAVIPMPVPSSYNDITNDKQLRDFVGWAWYDREFYVDKAWLSERTVLRFDSAHYNAIVWVNGIEAMRHEGGHLPFEAEVMKYLNFNGANRVTVAINNTLSPTTLPPGTIEYKRDTNNYPPGYFVQNLQMDFFNYAGIHRHVTLYTTTLFYIEDIDILTDIQGSNGIVKYSVYSDGKYVGIDSVMVEVVDNAGEVVGKSSSMIDSITIPNAKLWWPYTMTSNEPGYMYTFKVTLTSKSGTADVYRQPFGIRTVRLTNSQILINDKPFYCHGVSKHEDSDIRGKGLDYALIARDFNMLKWLGVNCFRTSHYPYAEEIMDQADQQGIVVIDESPGVGIGKTFRTQKCRYKSKKVKCAKPEQEQNKYTTKFNRIMVRINRKRKQKRQNLRQKTYKSKNRRKHLSFDASGGNFGNKSLVHHLQVMSEMFQRDKNRPAVIFWSVANEPATNKAAAGPYFKAVINHVRALDPYRPITFACNQHYNNDVAVKYVDIIMINRYYGWYSDVGHTEVIQMQLEYYMREWHKKFNKPIMLSEYGADTIAGFHQEPSFVFTEEYQVDFLKQYHKGFDNLRKEFFVGELVWNFADFMTKQGVTRVVGNKKGLLTRQRQPKMSAHLIRERYTSILTGTENMCKIPT